MGNFYIVTSSSCGPCQMFKSTHMLERLVKFLYDNIQNVNVYWYDLGTNGKFTGKEMFIDNSGKIVSEDTTIRDDITREVSIFPQLIYQRVADANIFSEVFAANNESDWERLLTFVEENPDIYQAFDGILMADTGRKSPRRSPRSSPRCSPRRSPRSSPRIKSDFAKRNSSPSRKGLRWTRMR